ncbi:hypothetical protein RHSIM_Rhsim02G0072500 [Rhododendron simsii]|uniref:Uncharacterized protein n=1 Tax=Rhododendron simsii TaxID=118357 RepID=A0A834HBL2_RHOSS|nr:hypothetical protein RHSIM_Rhsim02G0072500 [Rhododendron simsii]
MGDYQFTLTGEGGSDVVMTWNGLTYWKLSMDTRVYKVSNLPASYMVLNETGLYLVGANSSVVVVQLNLGESKFRIAKLEYNGRSHLQCSCPPGFHVNNQTNDGCSPVYDSYSLPSACNASENDDLKVPTSYMKLGDGPYGKNDSRRNQLFPIASLVLLPSSPANRTRLLKHTGETCAVQSVK